MLNKWQPIETAPQDGSDILLFSHEGIIQGRWCSGEGWVPVTVDYHGCGCCGGDGFKPAQWMPLP